MNARISSREVKLFRSFSSQFKEAVLHPVILASELYSAGIIDEYTRNKVSDSNHLHTSADLLINAVEIYLSKHNKENQLVMEFKRILKIFERHIPLNTVVEILETEYSSQGHHQRHKVDINKGGEKSLQSTASPGDTTVQGQKK
ncbi:PREDICTED: uncharacterized protein LOC109591197, partial [Amphimedon queenslandica]|uniref:Uncharacterized protein n=2 Tax=Amphimedon queenslandica TaxID=400682 RepID=A0AAN0JZJ4_AMPQE